MQSVRYHLLSILISTTLWWMMIICSLQLSTRCVLGYSATRAANGRRWMAVTSRSSRPIRSQSLPQRHVRFKHLAKKREFSLFESSSSISDSNTKVDLDRKWNVGGLQKEVSRLTVRCHKKIGKARQRLDKATKEVDQLIANPDVTVEELEDCPNVETLEMDVKELQTRLQNLNKLEVRLVELGLKGKSVVLPADVAALAIDLEVNDTPPAPQERVTKKEKGPRNMQSFRLPYRRYYSENKTEIRVGKQAEDNDELSTSPEHRDSADWWMHASGCPGSHIIIRSHDQNLDNEVLMDAASLAARQSKCTGNTIKVSMTRARDVKKPPGAKAGLVQLTGQVRTIAVNMKEAQSRLDRLDKTVLVN